MVPTLMMFLLVVSADGYERAAQSSPVVQQALQKLESQRRSEATVPLDGNRLCGLLPGSVGRWKTSRLVDRQGNAVPSCADVGSGGGPQGVRTAASATYTDGKYSTIKVIISDHAADPAAFGRERTVRELVDFALVGYGGPENKAIPAKMLDLGHDVFGLSRASINHSPERMTATDAAQALIYARRRFRVKVDVIYLSRTPPPGVSEVEAFAKAFAQGLAGRERSPSR